VYHVGTSEEILSASGSASDSIVLMLHIDFILEMHQIHGYVAFILDVSALHDLKEQINLYLDKVMGQG
jgi:chemotaxis protein CheC